MSPFCWTFTQQKNTVIIQIWNGLSKALVSPVQVVFRGEALQEWLGCRSQCHQRMDQGIRNLTVGFGKLWKAKPSRRMGVTVGVTLEWQTLSGVLPVTLCASWSPWGNSLLLYMPVLPWCSLSPDAKEELTMAWSHWNNEAKEIFHHPFELISLRYLSQWKIVWLTQVARLAPSASSLRFFSRALIHPQGWGCHNPVLTSYRPQFIISSQGVKLQHEF